MINSIKENEDSIELPRVKSYNSQKRACWKSPYHSLSLFQTIILKQKKNHGISECNNNPNIQPLPIQFCWWKDLSSASCNDGLLFGI